MRTENLTVRIDILNLEKLQSIIGVLKKWAEDDRIPEDARQEMVDALNEAMNAPYPAREDGAKVFFECDRRACDICNLRSGGNCHQTSDIRHAVNFTHSTKKPWIFREKNQAARHGM